MIALWNHHPYAAAAIVVLVLIGLAVAKFYGRISLGELISLTLEVAIVAMIFSELRDGAEQLRLATDQITVLNTLNTSASLTEKNLEALQQAQDRSIGTLKDSLKAIDALNAKITKETDLLADAQISLRSQVDLGKQQSDLITRQLGILQSQYEAQNRHPVLEVRVPTFTLSTTPGQPVVFSTLLLNPDTITDVNVGLEDNEKGQVRLELRNVGDAPLVNVNVVPTASKGIVVRCVVSGVRLVTLERLDPPQYDDCSVQQRMMPPIEPRPKDRPEHMTYGSSGREFDPAFDADVRVNFIVPLDVANYELEVMILGNGLNPARYDLHLHSRGKPVIFNPTNY